MSILRCMPELFTYAVVISTYNRSDDLRRCLAALNAQTFRDFNVIIVNGGDEAGVRAASGEFPALHIKIVTQEKQGIVEARNLGWREARADIVCLIDDDLVVTPQWLEIVRGTFLSAPGIGGVSGPTLITEEFRIRRDLTRFLESNPNIFFKSVKFLYDSLILENRAHDVGKILKSGAFTPGSNYSTCLALSETVDVDYLEACHMCFRRELLVKVGGFDDYYGVIGDWSEPDLAFRVRASGQRLVFNPRAVTYHCVSRAGAFGSRTNSYERSRNFAHFYRRWVRSDTWEKRWRFCANLVFINVYWFYKFFETGNPDWLKGLGGTIAGLREFVPKEKTIAHVSLQTNGKSALNPYPLVSVVVVNYNGRDFLDRCISSILSNTYPHYEIIIVDNGSSDFSLEFIQEKWGGQTDKIRPVRLDKNYGPAKARNIGAAHAAGEYMGFLDNDTQVDTQWISRAAAEFKSDNKIGILQCKLLLLHEPERFDYAGEYLSNIGFLIQRCLPGEFDRGAYDARDKLLAAKSAGMFIRTGLFKQIGGFDEDYFIYVEETDLGWRAWLRGFETVFLHSSIVYHELGSSGVILGSKRQNYLLKYHGCKNYIRTLLKNLEVRNLILILIPHIILWLAMALYYLCKRQPASSAYILKGIWWNALNLKKTLTLRRQIQTNRAISDKDLFKVIMRHKGLSYFIAKITHVGTLGNAESFNRPRGFKPVFPNAKT